MSSESPPARKAATKPAPAPAPETRPVPLPLRLLDWLLIGTFLALVFLLGVFPLKDTDFWWHLRTGDWIRQNGRVPVTDLYTFTVPDHRWIDLHWLFQIALSWGYAHGGVPALNLAKCAITCVAVFLLLSARRRDWPVWVMLLAWLPALLVLSGRMYVRPETLTLLYLSADLAILFHWDRRPALAWALPAVQLAWVNTQGLFVLGPVMIAFALIAALTRPDAFSTTRRRWWRTVSLASLLTGAACLVNPYGLSGALYPLELARTMNSPLFSRSIAELMPVPDFIRQTMGWRNVPLRLHVATILIGALSFVIPILWAAAARVASRPDPAATEPPTKAGAKRRKSKAAPREKPAAPEIEPRMPALVFRLLLFATFTALSWQATRNSHQFAAVVGSVTAWNFAEWAAALARRSPAQGPESRAPRVPPRLATFAGLLVVIAAVASGQFYALAGEGRTVGLGEEPLWYPHEAARFAGSAGMPERFVSFHDGYAPLYEYYHGPERKVFADARLEVIGPELFRRYVSLRSRLTAGEASGLRELDELGRPVVLVGHADSAPVGATLMASDDWRCVWFDSVAALFVHKSYGEIVAAHEVDFAAEHFRRRPVEPPADPSALLASARGLWSYSPELLKKHRSDVVRPMVLLGLDYAARLREADPDAAAGWKVTGQLEMTRDPLNGARVARYRLAFDPVFDLTSVRATYALRRASLAAADDFMTLLLLENLFEQRGMHEARLPVLRRLLALPPINPKQGETQRGYEAILAEVTRLLAPETPSNWENLSELDRIVNSLLAAGRAGSAADLLERAYPGDARPWEITDRIATLRLHLGEAERARALWQSAGAPPRQAIRQARVAVTYLAEGAMDEARRRYQEALRIEPDLFEARYGLAVLEEDAGRAPEAHAEALRAVAHAPDDVARTAAQAIVNEAAPFARQ